MAIHEHSSEHWQEAPSIAEPPRVLIIERTRWCDHKWIATAERLLQDRGLGTQRTRYLKWPDLFTQSNKMCDAWADRGIEPVDRQTTAVVAAADHFNVSEYLC